MKIMMIAVGMLCLVAGCATGREPSPSNLTPGMTKKYIVPGTTTQTAVVAIFGPPDLVTRNEGKEVWTYDKISQAVSTSNGFLTILIAGYSRQRTQSTNRSIMLIVYFDRHDRVIDYRLSAAKF